MAVPFVLAGACTNEPEESGLKSATAEIQNHLPADGCSYVVKIGEIEYAPDDASRAAIIERNLPYTATVEIKYRLTGQTGQVECERGFSDRPEIELTIVSDAMPVEPNGGIGN